MVTSASCKKDKNESGGGNSYYEYGGEKNNITLANEKHIGGDIFLELTSKKVGNYLQINFAGVAALPIGVLTYHADRNSGYNLQTNFWATALGIQGNSIPISGGTITVSKSGNTYKIVFNLDTANGKITGEFNGVTTVSN